MRAKLNSVKTEMRRRMHHPIPEQGRWLASVLQGHYNYYAVPDNSEALRGFRDAVIRHWRQALAASQPERPDDLGAHASPRRSMATPAPHPSSLAERRALTPEPKGGAQCVRRARWDLCGGPPATAVPTAMTGLKTKAAYLPG